MTHATRGASPLRLAAIDIGTNSVKLLVGDVVQDRVRTATFARETTRLGGELGEARHILRAPLEATARVVARFAGRARRDGATDVTVFATHTLRVARNALRVQHILSRAAGTNVRVLSGRTEARWACAGALSAIGRVRPSAVVFDIGGGSVEVVAIRGRQVASVASRRLGALALARRFLATDPPGDAEFARLDHHVCSVIRRWFEGLAQSGLAEEGSPHGGQACRLRAGGAQRLRTRGRASWPAARLDLVASGGAATVAASMCGVHPGPGARALKRSELLVLLHRARHLPLARRAHMRGLPADHADIIVPGLLVALRMVEALGKRTVQVSPGGVREGALIERARSSR